VTSPAPGAESPVILIVDDNQQNLKLARDVLHAAGFRTLEAQDGTEGIALANEHLPDVILMDLQLPDMDGTDAALALGGSARTERIPVVALSAVPLEGGEWFLDAGFSGYLEKPISVAEFPDQVRRYCARAKA
jgi:two-component system, cell cycle response regulator DivK